MSHESQNGGADDLARLASVGRRRRVLVVDDDPYNRALAELRLRDAGFAVETADTAEKALNMVKGAPTPDAVLSDIQMPGMDGYQLREALRRDSRLARIPIVLLSSALVVERARSEGRDSDGLCVVRSSDLHEAIAALTAALREPPQGST